MPSAGAGTLLDDFNVNILYFSQVHPVYEFYNIRKLLLQMGLVASDAGEADGAPLPGVKHVHLCDRDVEGVPDAVLDGAQNPAFALEGVIFRQYKVE